MPAYTSKCDQCGEMHSYVRTIANRLDTPECCGGKTVKVLDAPIVSAGTWTEHKGFATWNRDGSQAWIGSGSEYNAFLRKNDFVPESEGAQEATIKAADREKAEDKALTKAVEQAVRQHAA